MAVSQVLSVTEVANSSIVTANTSKVRILWTSTQTGDSWNGYTKTAYYYVSINGGAETQYSVSYSLPKGTTNTIVDTTITVAHKDDGSGTVRVRTWMDTGISAGVVEKSQTLTLTTIARASQPSCVTYPNHTRAVGNFGDTIEIHMNRKSSSFTHYVYYTFGTKVGDIAYDVTYYTYWTIPLELINELEPHENSGWGEIHVETFTDGGTKHVGSNTVQFEVTVPDIAATKPSVSMSLNPVGAVPSTFDGLYIQGLTKVKANLSATGKYGARISSYLMKVDGVLHDSGDAYTSSYLTTPGEKTVYGYATDTRGHMGEAPQTINVIPYSNPKLEGANAVRCDEDGNASESGTYLKISGKRSYSPCVSGGVQKNFCKIQFRYSHDKVNYTEWATILDYNDLGSDEVTTEPLLGGTISAEASYLVHIRAIDDIGKSAESFITIPTDKVYMHRDGARNAIGLGKYNERDNAVDSNWDFYLNDHRITGLAAPKDDTDAVPKYYVAPKDIELGTRLSAIGWYKIGIITANMCSVTTLTIGGIFENNQVIPAMVDIATHYSAATIHLRLASSVENQISRIGITMESPLQFGVYAYYNSTKSNPVNINAHSHMGKFQKDNWVASSLTDADFMTMTYLKS